MIDKVTNLQQKAAVLRELLARYAADDADAESLLRWLTPLFSEIQEGKIIPPQRYAFGSALGKEPSFYQSHPDVASAEAHFIAALEDWESKDWYRRLKEDK